MTIDNVDTLLRGGRVFIDLASARAIVMDCIEAQAKKCLKLKSFEPNVDSIGNPATPSSLRVAMVGGLINTILCNLHDEFAVIENTGYKPDYEQSSNSH